MANLARTIGVLECDVNDGSGIGNRQFRLHCKSVQTNNVNARPIGGVASAAVTVWTALAMNNLDNPFCGTLVAQLVQSAANTGTIRLRVRGYDHFGEYQEEITPVVSYVAKTNCFIYLAKCWSYVLSVEFQSTGLDIGGDTLSVGTRWDWTRTVDASNEHLAGRNLGIAVPLRSGRVPGRTARTNNTFSQRVGPVIVSSNPVAGGTEAANRFTYLRQQYPEQKATGYFFLAGGAAPSNNDTVTVDAITYTWKTALTGAANEIKIGASGTEALQNMRYAINGAAGQAGILYGAGTVANATCEAGIIGTLGDPFLLVLARIPGAYGNSITVAESGAVTSWLPLGQLFGGADAPWEVNMTVFDQTGWASSGAITHQQPGQLFVGWNEVGWSGPVEKVHIYAQVNVAQWAVADDIFVTLTLNSADNGR